MPSPPLASELLHLNCSLHAIRLQCAKLRCEALLRNAACDAIADEARRRSHSALLRLRVAVLRSTAGFNPDQPRVPAGNPEGGQWTSGGGGIGWSTISSGAQWAQRRLPATVDYSNAMTGISTIDDTTKKLGETLRQVVDTEGLRPRRTTVRHIDPWAFCRRSPASEFAWHWVWGRGDDVSLGFLWNEGQHPH